MADLTLTRPTGLQESGWTAISAAQVRLERAVDAGDRVQTVGCCKELVESVAKVVLYERGETVESAAAFPAVIGRAHAALARQPGQGLSASGALRDIASGAKTIATQLAELRNTFGSGHGRSFEPQVEEEVAAVALDGTFLWVRWALRRLEQLLYGALAPLLTDLDDGGVFRAGDLSRRLLAADLPHMEPAELRRLGIAVGQRAMRDTFNVRIDGVEACANGGLETWPESYRLGLLDGIFFGRDGALTVNDWSIAWLPRILEPLPDIASAVEAVAIRIPNARLAVPPEHDWGARSSVAAAMSTATSRLPQAAHQGWLSIAETVDPGPF